jgi:uncharacterized ferritin-like protein (DUF455 family)
MSVTDATASIFDVAECCLFDADIAAKLAATHHAQQLADQGRLSFERVQPIRSMAETCFPTRPQLLMPRDMPRRRYDTDEGRAAFFHALAHIEFVAIYLAWDIIYRFPGLPEAFYRDWLRIADEEALHFDMIRQHMLKHYPVDYGELPAHSGLWLHAEDTAHDILARLAIVPRCMEARGLDVTPAMIDKLTSIEDHDGAAILTRIYQDEIGHVERGSYWFKFVAEQRGLDADATYKALIVNFFKGKPKGPFNREARIIAGFSGNEIDWLEERGHD